MAWEIIVMDALRKLRDCGVAGSRRLMSDN
jgi:hypothetical protein